MPFRVTVPYEPTLWMSDDLYIIVMAGTMLLLWLYSVLTYDINGCSVGKPALMVCLGIVTKHSIITPENISFATKDVGKQVNSA